MTIIDHVDAIGTDLQKSHQKDCRRALLTNGLQGAGPRRFAQSPKNTAYENHIKVSVDQKTETEIIKRVLQGDRQAYAVLVDAYKNPIYNLAYRMTSNPQDAEDLAQETFIRAYQNLARYDQNKKFFTWLYTIGINLIRNHLKKTDRHQIDINKMNIHSGLVHDHIASAAFHQQAVDEKHESTKEKQLEICLQQLSPELREILVLRFYQGLSFDNIADITGYSTSAVKMRVYRGLETLKKMMPKM